MFEGGGAGGTNAPPEKILFYINKKIIYSNK